MVYILHLYLYSINMCAQTNFLPSVKITCGFGTVLGIIRVFGVIYLVPVLIVDKKNLSSIMVGYELESRDGGLSTAIWEFYLL